MSSRRGVGEMLAVLGVLFALHAAALPAALRLHRARPRLALALVLGGALMLRALLLPAGLAPPADPETFPWPAPSAPSSSLSDAPATEGLLADLRQDWSGPGVAFDRFLLYDDDVWRYLWDGRVGALGLDPYGASPEGLLERLDGTHASAAEVALGERLFAGRWAEIHDRVRFASHRTVYPPASQALFRLAHGLAPGSVLAWKLLVVLLDLLTCALLAGLLTRLGRPSVEALLYAWNPLAIKEVAGSGHGDPLMIALTAATVLALVVGLRRTTAPVGAPAAGHRVTGFPAAAALAALGSAIAAKLAALTLVPAVLLLTRRRWWWVLPAALLAWLAPHLGATLEGLGDPPGEAGGLLALGGALASFGRQWVFNAGFWNLAAAGAGALGAADPEAWARGLGGALVLLLVVLTTLALARRGTSMASPQATPDVSPEETAHRLVLTAFLLLAAPVLLSSAVMPWYLLWALPFAVAAGLRSWSLLTLLALPSYLIYAEHLEHPAWLWVEHGGFALAFALELALRPPLRRRLAAVLGPVLGPLPGGGPEEP